MEKQCSRMTLLKRGDRVTVKDNSFYNHMDPGQVYQVVNIWTTADGRKVYSFKKIGKRGKPIGKSFSHRAISIDNSITSAARTVRKV